MRLPECVSKAFAVLVHVTAKNGPPQRESFVLGCSTRQQAEATIKALYPSEQTVRDFALALSATETEALNLIPGEVRQRQ